MKLLNVIFRTIFMMIVLLGAICINTGCQPNVSNPNLNQVETSPQQMLQLHMSTPEGNMPGSRLDDTEIQKHFNAGVHYVGVSDVQILLNGNFFSLENVIRQGSVDADTLSYWGAVDAKNGFCIQKQASYNGLNNVTFYYPDYNIRLVNDVLETPKGEQYLVTYLAVFEHLGNAEVCADLFNPETGISVSQEDWGLTFTAQANSSNLVVAYTQHGGTAIGTLKLDHATLRDLDGYVYGGIEENGYLLDFGDEAILPGQSGSFTCQLVGAISAGEYMLYLTIRDNYDTQHIHPLLSKHKSTQSYCIPITIN